MRRLSKKWANYRRRYHYLRLHERLPMGPIYINLEPTNACNLECATCSIDGSRKRGFMDMDLFRKIIDDAYGSNVYEVALFLGGEPLLHKDLPAMVEYVARKGLEPRIYTNACLLDRERSAALIDAGLVFLGVSFDGDNKEDYEAMRVGANYEQVLGNVIDFLKIKKENGVDKPYVSLLMLKMMDNPNQEISPDFVSLFDGLPINEFTARNPHDWRGEMGDIIQEERGKNYYPCMSRYSAMSIAWDGDVVGCSADLNGREVFGNLREQTIMEVWNGDRMSNQRQLMKEKRYDEILLCKDCKALWSNGHPRLSILSQLPPFEQTMKAVRLLHPKKRKEILGGRESGAVRTRKS